MCAAKLAQTALAHSTEQHEKVPPGTYGLHAMLGTPLRKRYNSRSRVSFSEPGSPGRPHFPGEEKAWDNKLWWTILIVALFIRFFRLGIPSAVVFDEFHFGKFVDHILRRELYFDIHPPLGKLTLAAFGYLSGYRPVRGFVYEPLGEEYKEVLFYPLREVAAIFGSATVPLVYATARQLNMSWVGSLLAAGLYCFDNLNVIESRLILMDSQVMFYLVLSLYCALHLWKTPHSAPDRIYWLTLTGVVSGLSLSVKWTALATPGLIAVVSFFGLHFMQQPLTILECMYAGIVGLGLYIFFFYIHFAIAINDGPGAAFFPEAFRQTLLGSPSFDATVRPPSFLWLFWYTNQNMLLRNAAIDTRHTWESYWYWWIVNWRGLLYYNKQEQSGKWASVYLLCNPVVCLFCAASVCTLILISLFCARYRNYAILKGSIGFAHSDILKTCLFLFVGWLANLLPYILVDRSAFVYHYLPGLLYAQFLSGALVDCLPRRWAVLVTAVVLITVIAAFVNFAPWVYAFPIASKHHERLRWYGRWD